ncbi:hypothetical protein ACFXJ5_36275 [Streptomyces sp. NPDC059373]
MRGLAAYHELAGEKGWPPLLWSFQAGYHFCEDADELEEWERHWAEVKATQISSVINGILSGHARLFPKSRWVACIGAQTNAIQSSLDMIAHPQNRNPKREVVRLTRRRPEGPARSAHPHSPRAGPLAFSHAYFPLSLGHERRRMGPHRTAAADPGLPDIQGRGARTVAPPGDRRRHTLSG